MNFIVTETLNAIRALYQEEVAESVINIQETRKEFEGQLTIVVFPIVRFSKKSPEETAKAIGEYLVEHVAEVVAFNVVKGFLNLSIADSYWLNLLNNELLGEDFGKVIPNGKKVMVDGSWLMVNGL